MYIEIYNNQYNNHTNMISKVIIPAAGFGTRLLPGSKEIPKEMFTIVNKPAIEYIANEINESDFSTMILITSKNKDSLVNHFDKNFELEYLLKHKNKKEQLESVLKYQDLELINIRQRKPLGLGHAVLTGKSAIGDDPFAVVLPDMLINNGSKYMSMMRELFLKTGKGVIALMEVPVDKTCNYGIATVETKDGIIHIYDLVEKPSIDQAPSNLAIVGRYLLPGKVFDILETIKPDGSGEIQLTDALKVLANTEGLIGIVIKDDIHDIGNPLGFIEANVYYGVKDQKIGSQLQDRLKGIIK
jgi:UTP--glucose-1-phosphate uridylyltransferase